MTEVAFARTFLAVLDTKPQKLTADHVEDPRGYPARTPYILPRMPNVMSKPDASALAPGQERAVSVAVRSLRNPPLDVRLPPQALSTSALDVKAAVAASTGIPADKLRLLHRKKPVADSKALKDLVADGETAVEFSVMVLGGAAAVAAAAGGGDAAAAAAAAGKPSVAQGESGEAVVQTEEFWADLKGFLQQRIRDEKVAEELSGLFKASWKTSGKGS